jgi:hypothetical protein
VSVGSTIHRTHQVDTFLPRYAATLTDLDADAAAEMWPMPGMIADDRSGVVGSREAMVDGLKQSYPRYQQLGLDSVGETRPDDDGQAQTSRAQRRGLALSRGVGRSDGVALGSAVSLGPSVGVCDGSADSVGAGV